MQRYEPVWELLSDTRQRLMSRGLTESEAETDIVLALRDRKLNYRATPEKITTLAGAIVHPQLIRSRSFEEGHKPRLAIPPDLTPADIGWENSRPRNPWRYGDDFLAHIGKLEVSTDDAKSVLYCGASDASEAFLNQAPPDPATAAAAKNVSGRGASDTPDVRLNQAPADPAMASTAVEKKTTAADKTRAIKILAPNLKNNNEMRTKEAQKLLFGQAISLGPTQFRDVWREARRQAGLDPRARAGRPRKSSR